MVMTENELIKAANAGNKNALETLLEMYKPLAKSKAKEYFLKSGDPDDLIQEGMIGLYKAVVGYDDSFGRTFSSFAAQCIERQIQSAVKASLRQKHEPLNNSLSLDSQANQNGEAQETFMEKLADIKSNDPEAAFISREAAEIISDIIKKNLSKYELETLKFHVEGRSVSEIAALVGKPAKSVDNALQRIRRKIERKVFGGAGKTFRRHHGRQQKVGEGARI